MFPGSTDSYKNYWRLSPFDYIPRSVMFSCSFWSKKKKLKSITTKLLWFCWLVTNRGDSWCVFLSHFRFTRMLDSADDWKSFRIDKSNEIQCKLLFPFFFALWKTEKMENGKAFFMFSHRRHKKSFYNSILAFSSLDYLSRIFHLIALTQQRMFFSFSCS